MLRCGAVKGCAASLPWPAQGRVLGMTDSVGIFKIPGNRKGHINGGGLFCSVANYVCARCFANSVLTNLLLELDTFCEAGPGK